MIDRDLKTNPIDETSDNSEVATTNESNESHVENKARLPIPGQQKQGELDIQIQKQTEINEVGMGVLTDGTAFLTGRGLARLCGIYSSNISAIGSDWSSEDPNPATQNIKEILQKRGHSIPAHPYIKINQKGGVLFHAYSDIVCLAVLEHYAFDAGSSKTEQALDNYRLLAGKALHDLIYTQVGYDPNHNVPSAWEQFHERVSLTNNSFPVGYFGIFKEIADMVVTLGNAGLYIDEKFVPDISVGNTWGAHWRKNKFDDVYGERKKCEHNYPKMFPQSLSNPQKPWCYPNEALAEFRRWFSEDYVGGGKLSKYINEKIANRELPPSFAQVVTKAYKLDE